MGGKKKGGKGGKKKSKGPNFDCDPKEFSYILQTQIESL